MQYNWNRAWLPQGDISQQDYLGFPTYKIYGYETEKIIAVPLQELEKIQCLVLLGEPGMGKSTAIAEVTLKNGKNLLVKFALNEFSTEEQLFEELEEQPLFHEWKHTDKTLFLYLDSLDEALLRAYPKTSGEW